MDSKMIEVIEHNWYFFGAIVNAPGDAVRNTKTLIACIELMDIDRYVPSVERIACETAETEEETEEALCNLKASEYMTYEGRVGWRLTDDGLQTAYKAKDTVTYYEAIAAEGEEWACDDCTVTMAPFDGDLWMFRVSAPNGKTCDVIPDTISDAVECFGNLENGESPVWGGWEDGSGNLVSDLLADEEEAKAE